MEDIIGLWGCTWTLWNYNADQSWPAKELNPQNENGKVVEQYFATFAALISQKLGIFVALIATNTNTKKHKIEMEKC